MDDYLGEMDLTAWDVMLNGAYDLDFDDGYSELGVHADRVRL